MPLKSALVKPPRIRWLRRSPLYASPFEVVLTSMGRSTSQTPSNCMRQNGASVWVALRCGPNRRSKRASSGSTSSWGTNLGSPRRQRPMAHRASKGLCGARLSPFFQTFSASRASSGSTSSWGTNLGSPRRQRPMAHRASKGLCGARLSPFFQTFSARNRCWISAVIGDLAVSCVPSCRWQE